MSKATIESVDLFSHKAVNDPRIDKNEKLAFVKAVPFQPIKGLALNPVYVYGLKMTSQNLNLSVGQQQDMNDLILGGLEIDENEGWEIFGSDHNSGYAYFGKKEDIDNFEKTMLPHVKNEISNLDPESFVDSVEEYMSIVRWDFDDNHSLVFLYTDYDVSEFPVEGLDNTNLLQVLFGAHTDDLCLHETIAGHLATQLKKVKVSGGEEEEEEIDCYGDWVKYNGKSLPQTSKNDLVKTMGYHIFCTLTNWGSGGQQEFYNPNTAILLKKLLKEKASSNMLAPTTDKTERLTLVDGKSNKEYVVRFVVDSSGSVPEYQVNVAYGRIGGNLAQQNKIKTPDLKKAQKMFWSVLEEKMNKGYLQDTVQAVKTLKM